MEENEDFLPLTFRSPRYQRPLLGKFAQCNKKRRKRMPPPKLGLTRKCHSRRGEMRSFMHKKIWYGSAHRPRQTRVQTSPSVATDCRHMRWILLLLLFFAFSRVQQFPSFLPPSLSSPYLIKLRLMPPPPMLGKPFFVLTV